MIGFELKYGFFKSYKFNLNEKMVLMFWIPHDKFAKANNYLEASQLKFTNMNNNQAINFS